VINCNVASFISRPSNSGAQHKVPNLSKPNLVIDQKETPPRTVDPLVSSMRDSVKIQCKQNAGNSPTQSRTITDTEKYGCTNASIQLKYEETRLSWKYFPAIFALVLVLSFLEVLYLSFTEWNPFYTPQLPLQPPLSTRFKFPSGIHVRMLGLTI